MHTKYFIAALTVILCLGLIPITHAQSLTLSITPPIFQLSTDPGETWSSTLKVVNTNPQDLTVFASVMNFTSSDEFGHGVFTPVTEEDVSSTHSLAGWISVTKDAIVIPKEKSADVPFTVHVPRDAEPGGHYAAILIGTEPAGTNGTSQMRVSSFVSSLMFIRIAGQVTETGSIREFYSEKDIYQNSDASFTLRFQNSGNVHIEPQGYITITNMWGKERGQIPVNPDSNYGNVLPGTIRKFAYEWQGEDNFFEVGRYKAVLTLTFGKDSKQNVTAATYFWVVPWKPTAEIFLGLLLLMFIFAWGIRAYVRKALEIEAVRQGILPNAPFMASTPVAEVRREVQRVEVLSTLEIFARPLAEGLIDLKKVRQSSQDIRQISTRTMRREIPDAPLPPRSFTYGAFLRKYAAAFIFLAVLGTGIAGLVVYFRQTLIPSRSYQVFVREADGRKASISTDQLKK